jgi:hypothetical protein
MGRRMQRSVLMGRTKNAEISHLTKRKELSTGKSSLGPGTKRGSQEGKRKRTEVRRERDMEDKKKREER